MSIQKLGYSMSSATNYATHTEAALRFFIDECYGTCGRLDSSNVVMASAKEAQWDARPSPKPRVNGSEITSGRGIACVAYEDDNGYAALVAKVEIDPEWSGSGQALHSGPGLRSDFSNPSGLFNQIEGGAPLGHELRSWRRGDLQRSRGYFG